MVLQTVLLAALLLQRARRSSAEKEAVGLSGRLLTAHEDERPSAILRIAENLEPIEDTDDDEDEKHETNSSSG